MGKYLPVLVLMCLLCAFSASCSDKEASQSESNDPKPQENLAAFGDVDKGNTKPQGNLKANEGIDVDLTVLSSTMVYAEVYNMMANPDDYVGKTIKMNGPYYASYFDQTGLYYHYIIIEDATACCQQGLEFIWNGDHSYPDDYPEEQTKIEVAGIFGSYDELDRIYYYLSVDEINIFN